MTFVLYHRKQSLPIIRNNVCTHTSVGILFHSSTHTSSNCWSVFGCRQPKWIFNFFHKFSTGFRSGLLKFLFQACSHRFTSMLGIVVLLEGEPTSKPKIYSTNFEIFYLILWYYFQLSLYLLFRLSFHWHWSKCNHITCYHHHAWLLVFFGRKTLPIFHQII